MADRSPDLREAAQRLVSAVETLYKVDAHDVGDKRPCATCDAVRESIALVRAAVQDAREQVPPRAIEVRLEHLATLPANWDSYGAVPITREALESARSWLKRLYVWPRSNGGLQLGWDEDGQDVQIAPDGTFESDEGAVDGVGAPPVPAAPRLPDTFIERAIQVAHGLKEPNADHAVILTAFEASAIRRGSAYAAAPAPEGPANLSRTPAQASVTDSANSESRPASDSSAPWRIHISEYEEESFLSKVERTYFVVRGAGKPQCVPCHREATTYDDAVFNSDSEAEALAVRDALNRVASGVPEHEPK